MLQFVTLFSVFTYICNVSSFTWGEARGKKGLYDILPYFLNASCNSTEDIVAHNIITATKTTTTTLHNQIVTCSTLDGVRATIEILTLYYH